ncbi:acid phosphatase [Microlunatus elymi]|uniref:Acid phosphatase n=1 Tax=Microlunatus elymi TaxID=2596828 RepID=A0A516Q6E7_9ACTN|nr:acid phosphatase [Microlunatus elymi]
MVMFENQGESQIIGRRSAPYLNSLARMGASYDHSHGVTHPSQPNYVALLSGSTQGVKNDKCPDHLGPRPNLVRQLLNAGHTFSGYTEDLPTSDRPPAGHTSCSRLQRDTLARTPWIDFSNIPASVNRPFNALPADLSKLPTVSFLIPSLCHSMHSCPISSGDAWASRVLPRFVNWARTHNSLLIVTFDEDRDTPVNHIPTILVGPMVRPGVYGQPIDHYDVLRTLEDMYALAPLGHAKQAAPLTCWQA